MVNETNEGNFQNDILNYQGKVLVDFWAPWCGPCKKLGPVLERVSEEVEATAKLYKVNVDDNKELSQKYGVSSIPTCIIFENGKEIEQIVGVQAEDFYVKKLS